jgi:hypothetical protein
MLHEIDKKILELDLQIESISSIQKLLSEVIFGHMRPTANTSFEGLFRSRNITDIKESEINEIKSIWYPDWNLIEKSKYSYSRCSDKGQNFFYCSNFLEATIKELNPQNDNNILIGVFHTKFANTKVRSQYAGIEVLRNNPNYMTILKDYQYNSNLDKKIEEIISSKFQERINVDENYKYKLSIAFSNILLKNTEIECLKYPSVASNLKFINYGLKPSFVDKHLYCNEIFQYHVRKTKYQYILTPKKVGVINHNLYIPKESKIQWKKSCDEIDEKIIIKFNL